MITRSGSVERQLFKETYRHPNGRTPCPYDLAWAPNGRELAYAQGEAGIRIKLVRADRLAPPRLVARDLPHPLTGLAWRRSP